jgi:hypothetical protein
VDLARELTLPLLDGGAELLVLLLEELVEVV